MTREDPAAFAPPPAFGPFRVLHQIGVGALGPVFRTYEPTRDRLIAVKVFRLDVTPEQAQALADELAKTADAGLFHPSIVEPVAAGLQGTVAYRAEEYVAAESLDVAIRHYAPAAMDKALPFITQLAGAIDFARAAGIGHGALHLRDIFVTPEEARASGFGVVEALERTGLRAPVRRPYAAPERIAGEAWSTPADVFSLAAIAYELLTGRRPAGTGSGVGPLGAAEAGPHAAAVSAVLARAMDPDPAARYQTALAFASALEAAASGADAPSAPAAAPSTAAPRAAAPAPIAAAPIVVPPTAGTDIDELDEAEPPDEAEPDDADIAGEDDDETVAALDEQDEHEQREPEFERYAEFEDPDREWVARDQHEDEGRDEDDDLSLAPPVGARDRQPEPADEDTVVASAAAGSLLDFEPAPPPATRHEDFGVAAAAGPEPDYREAAVGPPRTAMFPVAVGMVLGLLIGFTAAYAIFGRTMEAPFPGDTAGVVAQEGAATSGVAPSDTEAPVSAPPPAEVNEPAPVATSGTLLIESTPAKAAVTINKEWAGRTPLTLEDQPFGSYDVRVVQEGYEVATERVRLSADEPNHTVSVRLQRTPAPAPPPARPAPRAQPPAPSRPAEPQTFLGSMFVDSRPQGASVTLNGKVVGKTPLRLSDLAIGSHVVRLELPNHRIWSTSATVRAGTETRVSGSLEPIR